MLAALNDPARRSCLTSLALASYALIWTLYGVIAKSNQDIHSDTAESPMPVQSTPTPQWLSRRFIGQIGKPATFSILVAPPAS
jgi:hypothetical protein